MEGALKTTSNPAHQGRNLALDGVRGLAALFVLISHYMPQNPFWWTMQWGRVGVVTFFILSGYLIVSILLNSKDKIDAGHKIKSTWNEFYKRRALRIFPLYFGVLFVFCIAGYQNTIDTFWWHATFASNIGHSIFKVNFDNFSHFWSICVEEQFYLLIPVIVLCTKKEKSFSILCAMFFACMSFKIGYATTSLDQSVLARIPIANVEGISFGALIAYAFHVPRARRWLELIVKWLTLAALISFVAMNAYRFAVGVPAYYTFFNIAIADLVIACTFGPLISAIVHKSLNDSALEFLASKPLAYLGTISYGVYVYHYAMLSFMPSYLDALDIADKTMAAFFAKSILALIVAALSWHLFEKQILKLKDMNTRENVKTNAGIG